MVLNGSVSSPCRGYCVVSSCFWSRSLLVILLLSTTTATSSSSSSSSSSNLAAFVDEVIHGEMTVGRVDRPRHRMTSSSAADLILFQPMMKLTLYSAYLSDLVYYDENYYYYANHANSSTTAGPNFALDSIEFFTKEPDQALVAKADGYCFGVFRGTTLTAEDWEQNVEIGNAQVCPDDIPEGEASSSSSCCQARVGFWDAYNTEYRRKFEASLKSCAETCETKDECVVLTGHSQGGAVAAVAAIVLDFLNPYVITFGQPPTILAPCASITSERWYRWVNTKKSESVVGISYDPVPFAPAMGASDFGHLIILSEDDSGVAYVGLDSQETFNPLNVVGFEAHSIKSTTSFPGYLDRIEKLMDQYGLIGSFPIRANGYVDGSYCTKDVECESGQCAAETSFSYSRCKGTECSSDDVCESKRCDSGMCQPKLLSCQVCDENSDCASGVCSWRFRCADDTRGLMGDGCLCVMNEDCVSGRCEGWKSPICEPKLADGSTCDESSDCLSGKCNWRFRCVPLPTTTTTTSSSSGGGADVLPEISQQTSSGETMNAQNSAGGEGPLDEETKSDTTANGQNSAAGEEGSMDEETKSTSPASTDSNVDETPIDKTRRGISLVWKIVLCCLLVMAIASGYGWYLWWWKRRRGYEEIPTRVNF